jgi:hypothetical protein
MWHPQVGCLLLGERRPPTSPPESLRELRAAGFVGSHARNRHAIPPDRVVPLLVTVAAAMGRDLPGAQACDRLLLRIRW